jgi:hypothetical protein
MLKAYENRGEKVDIEAIAEKLDLEPKRVQELIGTLTAKSRMDKAMGGEDGEGDTTLASVIPDAGVDIESSSVDESQRETIRQAAKSLKPFQRRVIELHFNLAGGEEIEQKDLYDGVYVDPQTGEMFSSESTVISDRRKRGIEVAKTSQKDLNRRFSNGEVEFQAGTPESYDLALLKKRGNTPEGEELPAPTREQMLSRTITNKTGTPMTSGQIQDAKDQALYQLSQRQELQPMRADLRSRGSHELENSLQARTMVRKGLELLGDIEAGSGDKVKAGRSSRDGSHKRGVLGQMAEKRGWLRGNGSVDWEKFRADVRQAKQAKARPAMESTEELADLMSS